MITKFRRRAEAARKKGVVLKIPLHGTGTKLTRKQIKKGLEAREAVEVL